VGILGAFPCSEKLVPIRRDLTLTTKEHKPRSPACAEVFMKFWFQRNQGSHPFIRHTASIVCRRQNGDISTPSNDGAVLLAHLFISSHEQPTHFVTKFNDWWVFDALFSLGWVVLTWKAVHEFVDNEICRSESGGRFGVTKPIIQEKL